MITALIVDDEKDGREALNRMIMTYTKNVKVLELSDSAENAWKAIKKHQPDLVFLDIEMPGENAFDLLRRFDAFSFKIIFVTAHSHYAVRAFKFSAVDYLLKPIDIDDLVEAVHKADAAVPVENDLRYRELLEQVTKKIPDRMALPVRDGLMYIKVANIIRFEGDGSYTTAYLADGKTIMVSRNIKEYEELLAERNFFRCHISHLINLQHVTRFSRHDGYYAEMSDGKRIGIARRKKEEFISRMNLFS